MDCVRAAGLEIIMSHERLVPGHTWTTLMPEGYWCGYVGQGMVRCALSDRGGECCARADSLMVLQCPSLTQARHWAEAETLSAVFVRVVPDDAQALLGREVADLPVPPWTSDGPRLGCQASQRAVAWQMLTCPADAPGRSLYLSAKGLELLASLALPSRDPAPLGLAGTQRLYEARDILLATLEAPPSVPELARAVGLSARSLSRGFTRLFGVPVYAFVKARRLERARHLIETDALTIAEAAYAIGYHPSHLSTAFRRHYGVPPSAVRPSR